MTLSNDIDRQIAAFLVDGPIELPDRSFDAVRDEIERTRQRGSFLRWRVPALSDSARLITTAAMVLVAFVGLSLLGSRAYLGTQPTPVPCSTPSEEPSPHPSADQLAIPAPSASQSSEPSAEPSAPPSAEASSESCATPTPPPIPDPTPPPVPSEPASGAPAVEGGLLAPGTYPLAPGFPVPATIDVPDGWSNCLINALEQGVCTRLAGAADSAGVSLVAVENVVADPCADIGREPPAGTSVDGVVAAIRGLNGFESTEPVDVTVDGRPAKEFTLTAPAVARCGLFTWSSAIRTNIVGPSEVNRLRVVDVDGTRVLIALVWSSGQEPPPSDAVAVFESVRFPSATSPAPSASSTTSPLSGLQTLGDPDLQPGTAALAPGFPIAVTIDVPEDWAACSNTPLEQAICGFVTGPGGDVEVSLVYVENVVANPCDDLLLSPPVGPTVDDLVAGIRNLEGFTSTEPEDVVVGGHPAKEFTLAAPQNSTCNLRTWANGLRTNGVSGGEVNRVRIVDVDGTRIVIAAAWQPIAGQEFPDVSDVLDSIRFP